MLGDRDRGRPTLDGIGRRRLWPSGPGWYTEDDFRVDPQLGLAVVARGIGAIGGQGKPASKLAVWSVAGEVGAPESGFRGRDTAQARVQRGITRAHAAVARLSANWPAGLGRPIATMAALLLDGPTAIVAQIGDCQVIRVRADGLEKLTTEHTLANMLPAGSVPPELARVLTRALGRDGEPELCTIDVRPGDVFLLAASDLGALSPSELAEVLQRVFARGLDVAAVLDELIRMLTRRTPEGGTANLALVKVGHGHGRPATGGSAQAPGLRWLFAPGEPLADPPIEWSAGTSGGPDRRWFAEVFAGVMGDD